MIGTTQTSAFEYPRTAQGGHDVSWYGTLGVLAACHRGIGCRILRRLIGFRPGA